MQSERDRKRPMPDKAADTAGRGAQSTDAARESLAARPVDARPFDFERPRVDDSPASVASMRRALRDAAVRAEYLRDAFERLGDRLAAVNYPREAKAQRADEKRGIRERALRAAKGR
jgi:hypothetical protein